ncbi:MAG: Maf family protein [Lachnospiraceae bacterium]|nr:Maf family protein [Lachnospiraceae bacterium]
MVIIKYLTNYKIILASKSPRRKELLSKIFESFDIVPAVNEEIQIGSSPEEIVMNLATAKAFEIVNKFSNEKALVIGADTIVVYNGEILGKPKDYDDAFRILKMLSGKTHEVITGVCLANCEGTGNEEKSKKNSFKMFYEKTLVTFYDISDDEIRSYIDSKDPFDKAGAYGIQGDFAIHVKKIDGDYNNVVGLPVARIYEELKGC